MRNPAYKQNTLCIPGTDLDHGMFPASINTVLRPIQMIPIRNRRAYPTPNQKFSAFPALIVSNDTRITRVLGHQPGTDNFLIRLRN